MATAKATTRSILVELQDGRQMIVENIPANAKVTFGALQPGGRDYRGPDTAVRVYTTAGNQLAVFRNANSFRDLSLSIKVQKLTSKSDESSEVGPKGRKSSRNSETIVDWEDA